MTEKRALIVDDSQLDRDALEAVLKKRDFEVLALADGQQCMEAIDRYRPDIVLLDIVMPNVHGKQLLHSIRAKFNAVDLPVIMVTAKTETAEIVEALTLGANDFISKPLDYDVALLRMNTHLKISELSRHAARLKEIEAVNAMIATYNHEINNPLAVALSETKKQPQPNLERIEKALWRISDIVKRIDRVVTSGKVEYSPYSEDSKMVKIRKA